MALTSKQRIFVAEYVRDFNATRAARAAGYSEKTAYAIGWANLQKPEIAEEIERAVAERCMTKSEILVRLAEQARAEYSAYILPNGTVDVAALVEAGKAHLIKGVKDTQFARNIEFYDAHAALVQIGRYLKMWTDKQESSVEVAGALTLTDWRKRAEESRRSAADTLADFEDE